MTGVPTDAPVAHIVRDLARVESIREVWVFGSFASGEATPLSDVDLLVVHDPGVRVAEFRSRLQPSEHSRRIDASFFTPASLRDQFETQPSFAEHIHDQGIPLFQRGGLGVVKHARNPMAFSASGLSRELQQYLKETEMFRSLRRFNGTFVPCLAQLYSLARSIVIVKLLQNGRHDYNWRTIFDRYSELRPWLYEDLERLGALRVYYLYVQGRGGPRSAPRAAGEIDVAKALSSIDAVAVS